MKRRYGWVIFLLLLGLSCPLVTGCNGGNKPRRKKKKKKKKENVRQSRVVVAVEELEALRKKLAPKTAGDALKGFFECIKTFNHAKAYAYLDSASLKQYDKSNFIYKKLGMRTNLGELFNKCIRVQVLKSSSGGGSAKVRCKITLPNFYAIAEVGERLKYDWEMANDDVMPENQLVEKLIQAVTDKKQLLPEYQITFEFDAFVINEKGSWWVQFDRTWNSLAEAYKQAALKKQQG